MQTGLNLNLRVFDEKDSFFNLEARQALLSKLDSIDSEIVEELQGGNIKTQY